VPGAIVTVAVGPRRGSAYKCVTFSALSEFGPHTVKAIIGGRPKVERA
jgi:hypothetical protein